MFLAGFAFAVALHAQNDFPDDGTNHWAYEAVACFKSLGLMLGYPDGLGMLPRHISRYMFATEFELAATNLQNLPRQLDDFALFPGGNAEQQADVASVLSKFKRLYDSPLYEKGITYLDRGMKEFAPELRAMGVKGVGTRFDTAEYVAVPSLVRKLQPGSALKQFRDVPRNHWAAKDVLSLRSHGLIHGYPDDEFKG